MPNRKLQKNPKVTEHVTQGDVYQTIASAGSYADQILIGDTNHMNPGMRTFLSGEKLMKSLAQAGVSHVCLEIPQSIQHLVDEYDSGKWNRRELSILLKYRVSPHNGGPLTQEEMINSIIDTIDNAKKYGMKTHCVDDGAGDLDIDLSRDTKKLLKEAMKDYRKETGIKLRDPVPADDLENFIKKAFTDSVHFTTRDERQAVLKGISRDAVATRISSDAGMYENVLQATKGEKTAIIYGAGHDDLARLMKKDNPLVVDIRIDHRSYFKDRMNIRESENKFGQPHMVHILKGGQVYLTENADPHMMQDLKTEKVPENIIENKARMEHSIQQFGAYGSSVEAPQPQ